jgi:hypothetical protein
VDHGHQLRLVLCSGQFFSYLEDIFFFVFDARAINKGSDRAVFLENCLELLKVYLLGEVLSQKHFVNFLFSFGLRDAFKRVPERRFRYVVLFPFEEVE